MHKFSLVLVAAGLGSVICALDFTPALAINPDAISVPEPASLSLLGAGLLGLAGIMRRRRKN
jgi:hypothetical protein